MRILASVDNIWFPSKPLRNFTCDAKKLTWLASTILKTFFSGKNSDICFKSVFFSQSWCLLSFLPVFVYSRGFSQGIQPFDLTIVFYIQQSQYEILLTSARIQCSPPLLLQKQNFCTYISLSYNFCTYIFHLSVSLYFPIYHINPQLILLQISPSLLIKQHSTASATPHNRALQFA